MALCLHPISICVDRRADSRLACPSPRDVKYRDIRPYAYDSVKVPCGKCINCLKNRQAALVSRAYQECCNKGSFVFVTLTYDDAHLPIAQSLWRLCKDTGELTFVEGSRELVATGRDNLFLDRAKVISLTATDKPRYFEWFIDGFEDDEYKYLVRLTPSVCREDVRLWLKRCRVAYEREHGFKLSPFTYCVVSEYGPRTCRPHYHIAFFGLNRLEVDWLVSKWPYGSQIDVKYVPRLNSDGSDAWQIASRYIGKYMTKGKFDCDSVKDKSAEKPRICQSVGLGKGLLDLLKPQMCAFDMFGEYDLDTFFCPALGRALNEEEINQLCKEIPKRLHYCIDGHSHLPIPKVLRQKVFYHVETRKIPCRTFETAGLCGNITCKDGFRYKVTRRPSALWSLVSDSIRSHLFEVDSIEFFKYFSRQLERTGSAEGIDFAVYDSSYDYCSERNAEARYIDFLNSSIF